VIKAIILDCFGVLTTDKWRAFMDSMPADANAGLVKQLHHQRCSGEIDQEDFYQKVYTLTGLYPPRNQSDMSKTTKNNHLLEYAASLKEQGYKVGLLSNVGDNWITSVFLTQEEIEIFDSFVMSYKVGLAKPDPRIFEMAWQSLGVEPQETVMVDDIRGYCEAAEQLGMHTILYKDFAHFKSEFERLLAQHNSPE
jgi:epoxide hydrolase-like predicted phosphatase